MGKSTTKPNTAHKRGGSSPPSPTLNQSSASLTKSLSTLETIAVCLASPCVHITSVNALQNLIERQHQSCRQELESLKGQLSVLETAVGELPNEPRC